VLAHSLSIEYRELDMPTRLNVDWAACQRLYAQGFGPKQISDQMGVPISSVSKRAIRYVWKRDATAMRSMSTQSLAQRASDWTQRIFALVEQHLSRIEELTLENPSPRKLEVLIRMTKACDETARRAFGLDGPGTHGTMKIEVNVQGPRANSNTARAIDVDIVPERDSSKCPEAAISVTACQSKEPS
jgi:hypothetical protein